MQRYYNTRDYTLEDTCKWKSLGIDKIAFGSPTYDPHII